MMTLPFLMQAGDQPSVGSGCDAPVSPMLANRAAIRIRPVRPTDGQALSHFYAALSPASRYARFMGFSRGIDDDRARSMCTPDHHHDEGLVAVLAGPRPELIVGHLCLQPDGRSSVELAVAVSDEHQHLGIGRRLMAGAVRWAIENGFEQIIATAFADNWRVLRLLSATPYPARILPADAGTVEVVIPLVPEKTA